MTNGMAGLLLSVGLIIPAVVWAEEPQQETLDLVYRVGKAEPVRAIVTREDYLLVEGSKGRGSVKLPSHQVVDVLRNDRPPQYDQGLERYKDGRYAVAAKYFTEALLSPVHKDKPWVIEYCNYRLAESMFDGQFWDGYPGKTHPYSPPAEYYQRVLDANPRSRFLLDAHAKRARSLVEQGKFPEAEKAFLDAAAVLKKYREETARTGDLEYQELANRADALLKVARARLEEKREGIAQIPGLLAPGKQPALPQDRLVESRSRAEGVLQKYRTSHTPSLMALMPGAYTVMGRVHLALANDYEAKGNASQAMQAYADARWNYLQVVVQFGDRQEYLEEAIYFVGRCYDKLKRQEPGAAALAARYWEEVGRDFPNGIFAKYAAQDLARAGRKNP